MLIGEAVLRSNPRYELVLLDRLEPHEREQVVEEADGHRTPYGLLRPRPDSGLEPRVVSTDTALLFMTLTVPGPCPGYVRSGLGERLHSSLGRMVLDRILEVEIDGAFLSGAAGWAPLASQDSQVRRGGRTAELSAEAVRYGQALIALAPVPAELVATRLYTYGRRPVTPALRRQATSQGIFGDASKALRQAWTESPPTSADSPWRSWLPRRPGRQAPRPAVTFKLYVSPTTETLPAAVRAVATSLADAPGVTGFKVGRTVDGVARPDKMVAYFASLEDLYNGAHRVRDESSECAPHGVPFTAGITEDGLLSWAIDPPRGSTAREARSSWRTWVTLRLAEYLLDARVSRLPADTEAGEPWQIALARLSLDGVDTASWVPDPQLFDYAATG